MNTPTRSTELDSLLEHAGWLRRLARSLVLDDGEADDAVQETWLAAMRGGGAVGAPRAWLAGTLRNVVRMRARGEVRRRTRERTIAAERAAAAGDEPSTDEVVDRERALLEHVAALPEAQRDAIVARYYEGLPPREIARRIGAPVETVKSRIARGLQTLRRRFDEEHGDRRAWSAWLLPLARHRAAASLAPLAWTGAAAVVVALGGALALAPADEATVEIAEPDALAAAATRDFEAGSAAPGSGARADGEREAVASDGVRVVVVDADGGSPLPGARVDVLTDEQAVEIDFDEAVLDLERAFLVHAEHFEAGEDGTVVVDAKAPFAVRAATDLALGFARCEAGASTVEVALHPTPRVEVRVRGPRGELVDGAAVAGRVTVRGTGWNPDGSAESYFVFERTTQDGRAWFQDPLGFWQPEDVRLWQPENEDGIRPEWTRFHVHVPGATETADGAVQESTVRPPGGRVARRGIDLRLPETGAIELVIEGADRSAYDGTARLRVASGARARAETYEAEIEDGVARWPLAVVGIEVEIDVTLAALGARWTVTGAGPSRAGAVARIRTTRPSRPALTGRLVDADGAPHRRLRVGVRHAVRERSAAEHAQTIETDDAGRFRIEWEEPDAVAAPVYLSAWTRAGRGYVELGADTASVIGSHDFGDVELTLASVPTIRGRCLDPDGNPVQGAHVSFTEFDGNRRGASTDADGRFALAPLFDEETTLEARHPRDAFPKVRLTVDEGASSEPLEVVFERGATATVDLEADGLLADVFGKSVLLRRSDDPDDVEWISLDDDGVGRCRGVAAGTYDAELRLGGSVPLTVARGIAFADGATTDVPLPRLDTLLRPITVVARNAPRGASATVSSADGRLVTVSTDAPVLVPRLGSWSLRVSATGKRSVVLSDVTALPDRVAVRLPDPIEAVFELVGEPEAGTRYALRGEPGTEAEDESVSIPLARLEDARVALELPAPGRYRLVRSRQVGGPDSRMSMLMEEATTELVDVPPEPDAPIRVDLEAPARR